MLPLHLLVHLPSQILHPLLTFPFLLLRLPHLHCLSALEQDRRNFHAWHYRQYIVALMGRSAEAELAYTTDLICQDFSNYSAWHYRTILLPKLFGEEVRTGDKGLGAHRRRWWHGDTEETRGGRCWRGGGRKGPMVRTEWGGGIKVVSRLPLTTCACSRCCQCASSSNQHTGTCKLINLVLKLARCDCQGIMQ
jgi:hypothetical protein